MNNNYLSSGRKITALCPDDSDVFLDDCYIFPSETRKKFTNRGKTYEFEGNKAGFRPVRYVLLFTFPTLSAVLIE